MPAEIAIKICGFTRAEDAHFAVALDVWAIGVIFIPGTARYVEPEVAARWLEDIPAGVKKVGVFRDQSLDEIRQVTSVVKLDLIQLHGDESAADVKALGPERIIKTVRVQPVLSSTTAKLPINPADYGAAYLLVERQKTADGVEMFDAKTAGKIAASHPQTLIAGGLTPENVGEWVRVAKPFGVDVARGVELPDQPGVKDPERMRAFIDAVRAAT